MNNQMEWLLGFALVGRRLVHNTIPKGSQNKDDENKSHGSTVDLSNQDISKIL